jgi:hypothetical protein
LKFNYPQASIKDVQASVQEKPSDLKREHPALQNMKFINFLFLLVILALLNPNPDSESGSTDLIESGPGQDRKHGFQYR